MRQAVSETRRHGDAKRISRELRSTIMNIACLKPKIDVTFRRSTGYSSVTASLECVLYSKTALVLGNLFLLQKSDITAQIY